MNIKKLILSAMALSISTLAFSLGEGVPVGGAHFEETVNRYADDNHFYVARHRGGDGVNRIAIVAHPSDLPGALQQLDTLKAPSTARGLALFNSSTLLGADDRGANAFVSVQGAGKAQDLLNYVGGLTYHERPTGSVGPITVTVGQ